MTELPRIETTNTGATMLTLFVPGKPAPGGSKTAFPHAQTGRMIVMDACKRNKGWRRLIQIEARKAFKGDPRTEPIYVSVYFTMSRPKGHFGTGRNSDTIKDTAPEGHTVKPDATKLWRAAEDALTGIVWKDDAQIVSQTVRKQYVDSIATVEGMLLKVWWWEGMI